MYEIAVSDANVGVRRGYVYCVFAPRHRAVYIGQTFGAFGALGRLAQHLALGDGSSFRVRLSRALGADEVDVGPVRFAAVALASQRSSFHGPARDYREAVEGKIQYALIGRLVADGLSVVVVSHTRPLGRIAFDYIDEEAVRVEQILGEWLSAVS